MRTGHLLNSGALVAVLSVLVAVAVSGSNQQALPSTGRIDRTTANEAVAWSSATAERVNVGLTAREQTIVNVAMFEAANAVTKRYRPYALDLAAPPGTSIDAAVATAAHDSLAVVWPRDRARWNQLYSDSLARVGDGPAKTQGIEIGKAAAEGILTLRARDTPFPGPAFAPATTVGVWRPNLPELTPVQAGVYSPALGIPPLTAYGHWQPWTFEDRGQFRPGPPPAVNSPEYARDLNEVKTVGAFESSARTPDQTAEALFYITPAPRIYNPFAHDVAVRRGLDITDSSRLFALLSLALLDCPRMATIALGDIHGNAAALTRLLRSIEVSSGDTIVFLGDYIDRGQDARECIETILALRESTPAHVVCLLGNHEEWFLRTLKDYSRHSWLLGMEALDTIQSYSPEAASALRSARSDAGLSLYLGTCELPYQAFFDAMPDSHRRFFLELALAYETADCLCAHAGLDPTIPKLSAQPAAALIWGHAKFPSEYTGVLPVVYGHWNRVVLGADGWPSPYVVGNTICVDTSEYGVVTAIRMPDRRVLQSSEHDTRAFQLSL